MATSTIPNSNELHGTLESFNIVTETGAGFDAVFAKAKNSSLSIIRVSNELTAPFQSNNYYGMQWKNPSGLYGSQIVFGYDGATNKIAVRSMNNGTWTSWRII